MVREHRRRRRDGVFGQLLLARRSRRSLRQASARAEAAGEFPARGGGAGGAEDEKKFDGTAAKKELDGTAASETRSNDRLSGSCRGAAATAGAASARAAATATAGASSGRAAATASTSA